MASNLRSSWNQIKSSMFEFFNSCFYPIAIGNKAINSYGDHNHEYKNHLRVVLSCFTFAAAAIPPRFGIRDDDWFCKGHKNGNPSLPGGFLIVSNRFWGFLFTAGFDTCRTLISHITRSSYNVYLAGKNTFLDLNACATEFRNDVEP